MIPFLESIPAIVKLLLVFAFLLVAIRSKLSLGNTFFFSSILLGLLFVMPPLAIAKSIVASALHPKSLALSAVVSLILVLSNSMEAGGQMKRLLNKFQGLITDVRLNIVVFPALIGLLPMPGGAVFSCPMVKSIGKDTELTPVQLGFVNQWFRHIWEYWWPLYPGVLLTTTLAGLDLWGFVVAMMPITLCALGIGYLPVNRQMRHKAGLQHAERPPLGPFFRELTPILVVIVGGLGLGEGISLLHPRLSIAIEIGLCVSLCFAIGWIWIQNRMKAAELKKVLLDPQLLNMIYMAMAILLFKGVMEDSRAVEAIAREFTAMGLPLVLIVILLPFFVGGIVGITIGFVGSTLPILIPLVVSFGEGAHILPYMMLAFGSGFMGVLFTPMHLCFVLTNQYFGVTILQVYRIAALPLALLFTAIFLYSRLLMFLGGLA
ncbi:MAG: hypothetical protein A4E73_01252 [Syntrophaceae bacterium PtaU1.Bin231]|nr:MAG: hypothetical protein A4E73_01252 [Syntrophaceae bacterium PtaU1.Bin231]